MKIFLAIIAIVAACSPGWNDPIPTTPHPGYPCGYQGISCGNRMCCDQGQACGAEHTGCPAGACCFIGDEHEFGSKKQPTKQRPER